MDRNFYVYGLASSPVTPIVFSSHYWNLTPLPAPPDQLPSRQLVELPYQALICQLLAAVKRIYCEFGLSSWRLVLPQDVRVDRGEVSEKPLSDCVVSSPRQTPDGGSGVCQKPPRGKVWGFPAANGCNGSGASSPLRGISHTKMCLLRAAHWLSCSASAQLNQWRLVSPATAGAVV